MRVFKALGGEIIGALVGRRCSDERQFVGNGMDDIRAKAETWLRGRKRRSESRFWDADIGIFAVFRKGRWWDDGTGWCTEIKADDEFQFSRLSDC